MTAQSEAWNEFVDGIGNGTRTAFEQFVRSALVEIQPVTKSVRGPINSKAWPKHVWAEMEAIRKGEKP